MSSRQHDVAVHMADGRFMQRRICMILAICLTAKASMQARARSAVDSSQQSGVAAIPQWRLDRALNPPGALHAMNVDSLVERVGVKKLHGPGIGSTIGQDNGQCPMVKLPAALMLGANQMYWSGQKGFMKDGGNNVVFASWSQNFFANDWTVVYLQSFDGRLAFKAEFKTVEELANTYAWQPKDKPESYPNISDVEMRWVAAKEFAGYKVVSDPLTPNVVKVQETFHKERKLTLATVVFTDCDGRLLFVVILRDSPSLAIPGGIEIYDRRGELVAHAITDPAVARYQFIDTNGYLLATAESPALNQNMTMAEVPRDPSKGNVLPFAIEFEEGGYENSSRLLEQEYRWVLAAAIELRAIYDGHLDWTPWVQAALIIVYWCFFAFAVFCIVALIIATYRLVYPVSPGKAYRVSYPSLEKTV